MPPTFSIVIPAHGRPRKLRACLQSLTQLSYPAEQFEVIVVDDGSPAPLAPAVAAFDEALDLTLHRQEHAGPAVARNAGAARASGAFLAFTDDDCRLAPGWLEALADQFAETPDHLLGGRTVNALPQNPCSEVSQQLVRYLRAYFYDDDDASSCFFASNNVALPVERFQALGGFDASFPLAAGEDRDLCDRWTDRGFEATYVPGALVRHTHALTLSSFCKQHFSYGRGAYHFHQQRSSPSSAGPQPGPLSFYWNLLCYPLAQGNDLTAALTHASLMGLAQAANAAGFFYEAAH